MVSPDDPTVAGETCPTCGRKIPSGKPCPDCSATVADEGWEPGTEFTGPRRIAGYRILRELGAGGMGTVFEAFEEQMNRHVALKVLSRHSSPSARADKRFEQEAWIAGSLDHPNLVKVYERGTWEELSYFSMELVDGGSLHDVVENMKRWGRDDRWGLELGSREYVTWAIRQVVATARGLDYAHRQGVVHRDVKPMNLLLSRELGAVKIADFGLAIDSEVSRMTTEGKILGTLAYMAPEQILGKRDEIGPQTDIYALGVTLFELLTLELPYTGDTQQLYLNNVLSVEARRPRKLNNRVSHDLETVIGKALEKSPKDRYGSAAELADDLENVLHLRPIEAKAPGAVTHVMKWVRRKPVHAALIATLVVGVPVVARLGYRALQQQQAARAEQVDDLLLEARWFIEAARLEEALSNVARVLDLDPGNPAALRQRAVTNKELYVRRRGADPETDPPEVASLREQALADADRLIRAAPEVVWTHAVKAYLLREFGLTEEAEKEQALAERYRSTVPSLDELYYAAELAMDEGAYEQAIELFGTWYERDRSASIAIARRAQAYEGVGEYDVALNEYRLAVAINPGQYMTKIDIARLETERGNLGQAEPWLREALAQNPDSAVGYEILSFNLHRQGQVSAAAGRLDEALALFREGESAARRSLELNPEQLYAPANLSALLLDQNRLAESPDPTLLNEAVSLFESILTRWERMPGGKMGEIYASALFNRCDALIQMGELPRALSACFDVTAQVPDDPIAFYNLAAVYALLGRTDDALAALERDFELGDTDWGYLESDAWFESLRDDPRFIDLLDRMKRAAAG